MKFTYQNPTRIHFGSGQIAALAQAIHQDQKVLLVYGGGSIKTNGVYQQVVAALAHHQWLEFAGVEANPTIETMDQAVQLARAEKVDFVLAVGGGSVIDGSKYLAAAALYEGDGWDILQGKQPVQQAVSLGCVLTLPATGSEANAGAVLTKKATGEKLSFMAPAVQPSFAIMDPDSMLSLPERQVANGLVDAFVHVCEQYLTQPQGAMVQDGYAETLLRNLRQLAASFSDRSSLLWRENLMWTANQALNGLLGQGVSQDWATHLIGHELTAAYGIDHARTLAIVQPALLRERIDMKRLKLAQMGRNVFLLEATDDLAERTVEAIEAFYQSLGMAATLTQYGIEQPQIADIIQALEGHGMLALGEDGGIDLAMSQRILQRVV